MQATFRLGQSSATRAHQSPRAAIPVSPSSSQLVGFANAILAFEELSALRGGAGSYDAVIAMRLDLRLKADFPQLLLDGTRRVAAAAAVSKGGSGGDGSSSAAGGGSSDGGVGGSGDWLTGVRFAWREIGGEWRQSWTPTEEELAAARSNASRADMLRVSFHMQKARDTAFLPANWMR